MGAQEFQETGRAKTARGAFRSLVDDAQWECGHGGYTGTIAEKGSFEMFDTIEGMSIQEQVDVGLGRDLPKAFSQHARHFERVARVANDKWGPAVCLQGQKFEDGTIEFVFFGWASS